MSSRKTSPIILILLDGLLILPQRPHRNPDLADRLCRQFLRWIGERDSNDLSKIYMPLTPVGASYGYAFVRCRSDAEAQALIARSHGRVTDMNHTLSVQVAGGSRRFAEIEQSGVVDDGELGDLRLLELNFWGSV